MNKVKIFVWIILISMIANNLYSQEIIGQWNGAINVNGTELKLIFHIMANENGYKGSMDSPDQNTFGIPATSVVFENNSLIFEVKNIGLSYNGKLIQNGKLDGTFNQGGLELSLIMTKDKVEKVELKRPQTPKEPLLYNSEEVIFKNKIEGFYLSGTLTLPKKDGKFPAVILISGSGAQNRDEEIFGHKPFFVIADHLTKNGIAVLRYDDRGTAKSEGNFKNSTTEDFATDVESAINYLLTRKEIDSNKIGLIGHSEGGIIAPMVAVNNENVNFIVLMAGLGIPGDELLLAQTELISKSMGVSDNDVIKIRKFNKGAYDIVTSTDDAKIMYKNLGKYLVNSLSELPEDQKPKKEEESIFIKNQISALMNPWMIYFLNYNPAEILEKVECPVFAINGSKDIQVPAQLNLNAIKYSLEKGGNKIVTIKEFENLNHLFQECETGSLDEYVKIEQTFSPLALNEISKWIQKQVE